MDLSQRSELTQSVHRSTGSFEMVLSGVLFALLGLLVDTWAGTRPLFTVSFAVVGLLGAVVSIYYRYRDQMARAADERGQSA